MRNQLVPLVISFALSAGGHAAADWKYTKWGMSPEQVVAASGGTAVRLSPEDAKSQSTFIGTSCLLSSTVPLTIHDISFQRVNFCFGAQGRLSSVDLYSSGAPDFFLLDQALASEFGPPVSSEDGSIRSRTYVDKAKGNSIRLMRVASTILSYRPIPNDF